MDMARSIATETEKLVIKAIEEYINFHSHELDSTEIFKGSDESAYFALDCYRNRLIEEVWPRQDVATYSKKKG